MNKKLLISILVLGFAVTAGRATAAGVVTNDAPAGNAYGASECQPIYGGGDSCVQTGQVTINKLVQNPETKQYVDNLSTNDAKYTPDQTVNFKIVVTNTSNEKLTGIVLKDTLPEFVEFVQAPGDFDASNKTLTLNIDVLNENESRDFFIVGKIVNAESLPADQDIMCLINQASISMGGKISQDNSQFCIGKQAKNPPTTKGGKPVFPPTTATTTPETGPEALALVGLIPSALGGAYLRKKTK